MEKAETERNLLESVVARKLRFFGHIVGKTADCLETVSYTHLTLPTIYSV